MTAPFTVQDPTVQDPNAGWMEHMRRGDFASAWKISEQVLAAGLNRPSEPVPRHFQSIWNGSPLDGQHVFVRCYHGLGDTIQFIRYMPLVKAIARRVTVWAQASLIPLLETVSGVDEWLPLHDGTPDVAYDVDVEIMELPFLFRTTLATLPAEVPYLHVAPARIERQGSLAVGLIWRAGDWDDRRSIPFQQLAPLADLEGIDLHILQREPENAGWSPGFGILSVTSTTLEDAQWMRALDLVISVDTMAVHLAGALGVPVWTLLPRQADWRWMDDRIDSPWYPTMRLFRQTSQGNWQDVIARVVAAIKKLRDGPRRNGSR